jgi:polyhydroxyalkanoate synthesis regulator phasin
MLEDVRKGMRGFVEAGMAAVSGALTPARARDVARTVMSGEGRDQVNRVAQDLLEWSQRSREWIADLVQREVKRQLGSMGIATREDLDAVRKRVRELERAGGGGSRPGPKKSAAKKSTAKKSAARKSPAKKSGAKKSAAKRSEKRAVGNAPVPDPSVTTPATGLGDPGPGAV